MFGVGNNERSVRVCRSYFWPCCLKGSPSLSLRDLGPHSSKPSRTRHSEFSNAQRELSHKEMPGM